MDHVRRPVERLEQSEGGTRKESEANVVVAVAVNGRTREELRRFEQVCRRACRVAVPETNLMNLAAPLDAYVLYSSAVQECAIDLIVKWEDELGVDVLFG